MLQICIAELGTNKKHLIAVLKKLLIDKSIDEYFRLTDVRLGLMMTEKR